MKNVDLLKEVQKNSTLLGMQKNENFLQTKFDNSKEDINLLNILNDELKSAKDKKEISNKFFLSLRKEIRISILSINKEVLKTMITSLETILGKSLTEQNVKDLVESLVDEYLTKDEIIIIEER